MNNEKTIFMKHNGAKYVIHGLCGVACLLCLYHERLPSRLPDSIETIKFKCLMLLDYLKMQSQSGTCRDLQTGSDPSSHVDIGVITQRFRPQ